jgi:hypothetical protein
MLLALRQVERLSVGSVVEASSRTDHLRIDTDQPQTRPQLVQDHNASSSDQISVSSELCNPKSLRMVLESWGVSRSIAPSMDGRGQV